MAPAASQSQTQEVVDDSRFAELMKPIKDLTQNFNVSIGGIEMSCQSDSLNLLDFDSVCSWLMCCGSCLFGLFLVCYLLFAVLLG